MTYDFEQDYPDDLLTTPLDTEGQGPFVIKRPVWGGNINGYTGEGGDGRMLAIRALVLHTPEENADSHEATPDYFARRGVKRSTHDYADNDGDLFQMVSHADAAWGHGTHAGNRVWKGEPFKYPPWNPEHISNNQLSIGIEIEGRAATIHRTLSRAQYRTVALWIAYNAFTYSIPLDRDHVVGHYELAADKSDPGGLPIDNLIASAKMLLKKGLVPGITTETSTDEIDLPLLLREAFRRGRDHGLRAMEQAARDGASRAVAEVMAVGTNPWIDETLEDLLP